MSPRLGPRDVHSGPLNTQAWFSSFSSPVKRKEVDFSSFLLAIDPFGNLLAAVDPQKMNVLPSLDFFYFSLLLSFK